MFSYGRFTEQRPPNPQLSEVFYQWALKVKEKCAPKQEATDTKQILNDINTGTKETQRKEPLQSQDWQPDPLDEVHRSDTLLTSVVQILTANTSILQIVTYYSKK